MVCGWQSRSTKKAVAFELAARWQRAIASAAAVASSSSGIGDVERGQVETIVLVVEGAARRPG